MVPANLVLKGIDSFVSHGRYYSAGYEDPCPLVLLARMMYTSPKLVGLLA